MLQILAVQATVAAIVQNVIGLQKGFHGNMRTHNPRDKLAILDLFSILSPPLFFTSYKTSTRNIHISIPSVPSTLQTRG